MIEENEGGGAAQQVTCCGAPMKLERGRASAQFDDDVISLSLPHVCTVCGRGIVLEMFFAAALKPQLRDMFAGYGIELN